MSHRVLQQQKSVNDDKDDKKLPEEMVRYIDTMKRKVNEEEQNREKNIRSSGQLPFTYDLTRNDRLWSMKIKNQFIDAIIINADGYQEKIHMDMLLLLDSDISQALQQINGNLDSDIKEYKMIPYISEDALNQLICFAYKNFVLLTKENFIEITDLASKFRIISLADYCRKHFAANCTIYNAIKGYELSIKFFKESIEFFKTFIENHFEEIVSKVEIQILKLDYISIFDLLSSTKLNLTNEEIIWNLICRWINGDKENRIQYLEDFFYKVLRFGRLKESFLKNEVLSNELFPSQMLLSINRWIDEQSKQILCKDGYGLNYSNDSIYFQPRETKEILLVAGGWVEGQTSSSWEVYNYQINLWLTTNIKLDRKISYFGLELIDNTIYVFGGSNGREVYSMVQALNLNDIQKRWIQKCSMIESRCYVSSVVLNGLIYALGGFNQRTRVRHCECYHPLLNSWRQIADLNYARSDASSAVLNGKIYIAGGINDSCIERSVEIYYPEENNWRLVKSMSTPRTSFAIAAFQNKIWALGGNDGIKRTNTVECYNPENDTWSEGPSMLIKRSTFRASILRNELYVVGGYNGQSPICNVEKYVQGKGWTIVKEMRHDRSGLSLISVPNKFHLLKI